MFGMGMQEVMIIGIIAVLLFGKRLPEVAKSLGSSYREFRKGLNDLQSQVNVNDSYSSSSSSYSTDDGHSYGDVEEEEEATAPKFELPPTEEAGDGVASTPEDESTPTDDVSRPISEK